MLTLQELGSEASTAEVVAARPGGMSHRSVLGHLRRLYGAALVTRSSPQGQRWEAVPLSPGQLEVLAEQLHTDGTAALQRQRHDAQRRFYRDWSPGREAPMAA